MMPFSCFPSFSNELKFSKPAPLNICKFGDTSLFYGFWKLTGVNISFRCKFLLSALRTVCSVPPIAPFGFFLYLYSKDNFSNFLFKQREQLSEFFTNRLSGLFLGEFWAEQQRFFFSSSQYGLLHPLSRFGASKTGSVLVSPRYLISSNRNENIWCLWLCPFKSRATQTYFSG